MSSAFSFNPAAPHVAKFIENNPNFDLSNSLLFLVENYSGQEWIIEGGVAVRHYVGEQRIEPHDLDIVCLDKQMQADFNGSMYFDVKELDFWMSGKRLETQAGLWSYIMSTSVMANIHGVDVRLMSPAIIAAGKSFGYFGRPLRDKDITDIRMLGLSEQEINMARQRLSTPTLE